MIVGIISQWIIIFITLGILTWMSRGKNSMEKKSLLSFLVMNLIINVGYLFELMASSREGALFAEEIQIGGMIFLGYFMCSFFCYYAQGGLPKWLSVYLFVFDFLMLVCVWTGNMHHLIFSRITFRTVGRRLFLMYDFGILGYFMVGISIIFPLLVAIFTILAYLGRVGEIGLRRRVVYWSLAMGTIYILVSVFMMQECTYVYDPTGMISLALTDLLVFRFWRKGGFNMELAAADTAFSRMKEGIILLDPVKNITRYNDAAARIFPELNPKLLHRNVRRIKSFPLDLLEEYKKKELDIDGKHFLVERSVISDQWGDARGLVLVFLDQSEEYNYVEAIMTGRLQAEEARRDTEKALKMAEEANRAKSDFLANISHEIRTPMNAIVGLSELIIEESRGRKVFDFACDIKNASSNLLAIINDILDLSQVEAGKMKLMEQEYSTEQLLEESLHLSKITASSRGLQLKREISPNLPCRLIGDEKRVRKMISDFLNFGMKYTERGYVKLSVTHTMISEDKAQLIFVFQDTGSGFTPEELEHIFEQFRRMDEKNDKNLEGIGMGIAITKRFVDLMGGQVYVESEVGKGTTITIVLPQQIVDARTIAEQPWKKLDVTEQVKEWFEVPDYRVLVVDDNKINLKVAAGALTPYHFKVDEAKSGQQAIDMVSTTDYDMILMDHMMPEMDGIEATAHIRENLKDRGKKPVIIALSANAFADAKDMFLANGFQDFIAKPLDKNQLYDLLIKWIPAKRRIPMKQEDAEITTDRAQTAELYMSGVDVRAALDLHSGGINGYLELLELYYMDGVEKADFIGELVKQEDYKNYQIEVHGLKSASANIGAKEFSDLAKAHEFAAKEGNYEYIQENVQKLLSEYNFLLREIERVLKTKGILKEETPENTDPSQQMDKKETIRRVAEILDDVENFRSKPAAEKVEALLNENISKNAKDCLKEVKNRLKMYDDDAAEDLLRHWLEENRK